MEMFCAFSVRKGIQGMAKWTKSATEDRNDSGAPEQILPVVRIPREYSNDQQDQDHCSNHPWVTPFNHRSL